MNPADLNEELPKNFESSLPAPLRNCANELSLNNVESAAKELVKFCRDAPCFFSDFAGSSFEETKKKLSEHLNSVIACYDRGDIYDRAYGVNRYVYASILGVFYVDYCHMLQNLECSLKVLDTSSKSSLIEKVAYDVAVHSALSIDKL